MLSAWYFDIFSVNIHSIRGSIQLFIGSGGFEATTGKPKSVMRAPAIVMNPVIVVIRRPLLAVER